MPTGRAPSFTQPLLPAARTLRRPPKGTLACPLPAASNTHPRSRIGPHVDEWADHHAHYITNARGQRIFIQTWRPHSPPPSLFRRRGARERGIIHIVHGLNDYSNKYASVARIWVEAGFVVVAHDFHGHGRSDGFRAYTTSIQNYVDDARLTVADAHARLPRRLSSLPNFLLAHSLGGAVAIHLARDAAPTAFRGVMLTAPAVRVFPKPLLRLFAPLIATLAPLMPVQTLSFDPRRRNNPHLLRRHRDPLVVRSPVRARVGYEVLKSCDKIMSEAESFRVPVFVAHSKEDRVTNAKGTLDFHDRIGSHDKTVHLYHGRVHDLLSEKRHIVMQDMVAWAKNRL